MKFNDFIDQGKVRKGTPDILKAKSLMQTSTNHLLFLKDQKINDISAGSILVTYYEALREIIEAMCLIEGFKVYSHEAFTYYLAEKNETMIAVSYDNLQKLRNAVNYYGGKVNVEEVSAAKEQMIRTIETLRKKYLIKLE